MAIPKSLFHVYILKCPPTKWDTRDSGDPLNTSSFSHAFRDFIKRRDISHVRFHDLSHTNTTLMLLSDTAPIVAASRHSGTVLSTSLWICILMF